jgi:hypothetical protein
MVADFTLRSHSIESVEGLSRDRSLEAAALEKIGRNSQNRAALDRKRLCQGYGRPTTDNRAAKGMRGTAE